MTESDCNNMPPRATLSAPEPLREILTKFIRDEGLGVDLTRANGVVRILQPDDRLPCDATTLQVGGWITCAVAHDVADRLGIAPRHVGAMLNLLDIKARHCELGLFQ